MSKRPPKKPKVSPIRDQKDPETPFDSPVAVEDPPEQEASAPPAAEPEPRPSFKKRDPTGKHMTFFDRVASISQADWGTRAKIKVYRLDPIIDRTRGSEYKFVQIYHQAIDEDKLKVDHGSGRYRLYLNVKSAGEKNEKEADTVEIDILDPKFPPNIPAGEWVDDPRNKKWAWARPAGAAGGPPVETPATVQAAAASAASTFTDAIKTYGEIRKEVKQETAAPAQSGLGESLQIVQTIMAMKADNPMVDVMKEQLRLSNEAQQKALDREAALQKELRDSMRPQQQNGEKFGLKQILGELKEFLPGIKELMPQVAETARAGRTNWIDVAREVAPGVIDYAGKIALAFASRMPPMPVQQNGQQPHAPQQIAPPQNGNVNPPAAGAPPQQEIPKFVRLLSQPTVFNSFQRYFKGYVAGSGQTGGDFANWVFDGEGPDPLKDARAMGTANIMALLKQSPAWILFQADEAKLVQFVDDALAWQPAPEDEDDDDDDEVEDLTRKGV